jgi:outer membrane murein-binding lipoprotein Lpp
MLKNRLALAAVALSIAVTGGLAAATPAQASTASTTQQAAVSQLVGTVANTTSQTVAPDDSCWD